MLVTVRTLGSGEKYTAELDPVSYDYIKSEATHSVLWTILPSLVRSISGPHIKDHYDDGTPDLSDTEVSVVVEDIMNLYDDRMDDYPSNIITAIGDQSIVPRIIDSIEETVDARAKTYKVTVTCTVEKVIYVNAHNEDEVDYTIQVNNCKDLCEDGGWDLASIDIEKTDFRDDAISVDDL